MCQITKVLETHLEQLLEIEDSLLGIMSKDENLSPLVESALQSVTHARKSLEDLF